MNLTGKFNWLKILSLYKGEMTDEKEIISFNYGYAICHANYKFKSR
ncbi:hypothetical protein BN1326_50302 [Staphylococcus argenteus]|uniref:Uncharacterized protein n=1 Tax=Staphylococcus argenteus TaxID=985002 RepID=A0A7U7JTF0_9STAP|nr:hypothetical protein BN1326_50302 [Staphylococcus argenteus]CRI24380.1 hypothetical protein BN1326_50302 [Staphylococcus argenteus]